MVKQVEELCPEIQTRAFPREHESLDERKVCVHKTRPIQRSSRQRTELSERSVVVCTGVEPHRRWPKFVGRQSTLRNGRSATRIHSISDNGACLMRICNLDRAREVRAICRELHT